MSSVTQRIQEIKQPRGGYIKPSQFETKIIDDGKTLSEEESIHASVVGMAVDYLTRFAMGATADDAFAISLQGAMLASKISGPKAMDAAEYFLLGIQGMDEESIINACKLTTFDVWFRNMNIAPLAKTARDINPDPDTIHNIQIMVERSLSFWQEYGPIIADGFTFEGGYTQTVTHGDGDFLTKDTLWDFKVSKNKPTNKHTLQLLMYWIMGQHSGQPKFKDITNLGIFNPRLNTVYKLNMANVTADTIKTVETEVIGY